MLSTQRLDMKCIYTGACIGHFEGHDVYRFMSPNSLVHYSKVQQKINIKAAVTENLNACPFCGIEVIDERIDKTTVFECPNNQCLVLSCSQCRQLYHPGAKCKSIDQKRIAKEESKTYKIIKACPNCNVDIYRTTGCNHVRCVCGTTMCYLCTQDITSTVAYHKCPIFGEKPITQNHSLNREIAQIENESNQLYRRRPVQEECNTTDAQCALDSVQSRYYMQSTVDLPDTYTRPHFRAVERRLPEARQNELQYEYPQVYYDVVKDFESNRRIYSQSRRVSLEPGYIDRAYPSRYGKHNGWN